MQSPFRQAPVRPAPRLMFFAVMVGMLPTAWTHRCSADERPRGDAIFDRDNLVAWCIVPFDDRDRSPQERAEMLRRLGLQKFAYDYRPKHIPSFDAEMEAIRQHGIELTAWWFPRELNDHARLILDVLKRHKIQTQLWVTGGGAATESPQSQLARVEAEAERIRPIATAAAEIGCRVSLYNHGGWFGEPENQIEVIRHLNLPNIGIVYNLHHGHEHLDRFAELLRLMLPYLDCLNLNGMTRGAGQSETKILPIGEGENDVEWFRIIAESGYRGPIGIINHTQQNAELRLLQNLQGIESLRARWVTDHPPLRSEGDQLEPSEGDQLREIDGNTLQHSHEAIREILAQARAEGDVARGAMVFASAKYACLNCHRIGRHGGRVGPELSQLVTKRTPEEIVESVYWPQRTVAPEYKAIAIVTVDGQWIRGYEVHRDDTRLVVRDPTTDAMQNVLLDDIEGQRDVGSLMPDGLTAAMSRLEQSDLIYFLLNVGRSEALSAESLDAMLARARAHLQGPATFPLDRRPLRDSDWPNWQASVNRDRIYDFYAKQAEYFRGQSYTPPLLAEFPGLDGEAYGHWGNQDEAYWADDRWNLTDLGTLQAGVFRGGGVTAPRAVCVRIGDEREMSVCFDPATLEYPVGWTDGFVKFSSVRSGLLHGLKPDGDPKPMAKRQPVSSPARYLGFYRHEDSVGFVYRIDDVDYLDVPLYEDGEFRRLVAPIDRHPHRSMIAGGPSRWPDEIRTAIAHGDDSQPYAVDTIGLPFDNRWNALMYLGDLAFDSDGSGYVCTIQGDVWRVTGLDYPSTHAVWRRFASGLHQALGMVIDEDGIFVLGRDQITRLHDVNGDGEADFYECFSAAYEASAAGHDFTCGLQRDTDGFFYTATGKRGLIRITPDGEEAEVIATGFRNPDGLGLYPDGAITIPSSEGTWVPASMIGLVKPGQNAHFGHPGPRDGEPPELPLVYLPRALDNSSGGQAYVNSERWGPMHGHMIHFSYGAGSHFLVLRDEVDGIAQGAVVPLAGEFSSGAHRGRFRPQDGQLYVAGAGGWGNYVIEDGCLHRVRYTGRDIQLPLAVRAHRNGVRVTFSQPLDVDAASQPSSHFAQCWNYRYGPGYGSPEFSTRHPGTPGHDTLEITSAHVSSDRQSLFLELPELQPVNQLHLYLQTSEEHTAELFVTVHRLDVPFTDFPGYREVQKEIRPHPILADVAMATRSTPNPWSDPIEGAREVRIECTSHLSFDTPSFLALPGEPIRLTLVNPDVVPHNWALLSPDSLDLVGNLTNRYIADPDAPLRHYVPDVPQVISFTDIVSPGSEFSIFFRAPEEPGRYPYLCTFPGHWSVMNGMMVVAPQEMVRD